MIGFRSTYRNKIIDAVQFSNGDMTPTRISIGQINYMILKKTGCVGSDGIQGVQISFVQIFHAIAVICAITNIQYIGGINRIGFSNFDLDFYSVIALDDITGLLCQTVLIPIGQKQTYNSINNLSFTKMKVFYRSHVQNFTIKIHS